MKPDFSQYGFVHQENLIMACIGGSQAHGAKLGATDDTDWYGLSARCKTGRDGRYRLVRTLHSATDQSSWART